MRALADVMPGAAGGTLLSQLEYVVGRPAELERGLTYSIEQAALPLRGLPGLVELGLVEVCYYQQIMPFVVALQDGFFFSVTTLAPRSRITSGNEYEVVKVELSTEALSALVREYGEARPEH